MFGVKKSVIIRTAVLLLAIVNTSLQLFGVDVLPFSEQEVETFVTVVLNAGAAIAAWYKNNSFTKEAQAADEQLRMARKGRI